jgi:hypothetical protein
MEHQPIRPHWEDRVVGRIGHKSRPCTASGQVKFALGKDCGKTVGMEGRRGVGEKQKSSFGFD